MTDGGSSRLRSRVLALVALGSFGLTACATGSAARPNGTPTTGAPTTVQSTPAPASSAPASPTVSMSPTPTKTATAHPSTTPTSTPTALPADYCKTAQLTMMILPGGAEPNYEIAAVTFTNGSSTSCSLAGYPAVQLLLKGRVLSTAKPNTAHAPKLVHLAPGAQAQAQISDHITCQAPLSDLIRATAPAPLTALHLESTRSLVQMRGCSVTIDPIVLSS